MIDLTNVNQYSVTQLADAIESGECTFEDYQQGYLGWQKQAELREELKRREKAAEERRQKEAERAKILNEEAKDWNDAEFFRTIEAYQVYKQKWGSPDKVEYAVHLQDADSRIESLIRQADYKRKMMLEGLLTDMRENPWRYRQDILQNLFFGNIDDRQRRYLQTTGSELPYAEFLLSGNKLKMKDLYEAQVVPDKISQFDILAEDYSLPATKINEMGTLPENRTDVYFFGVPRSGKSSVLSGIIYKLWKDGRVGYEPQLVNGRDASGNYYDGLIRSITCKKPPQGTALDTVSCMKINLRSADGSSANPITIVELSGEAFKSMAESYKDQNATLIWKELGAGQCITNNNRKLLFFVLDYSIISEKNPDLRMSPIDQIMTLETALNIFTTDGPDPKNPSKGCTMSKVDTVAVIMTKCDLMNVNSHQERLNMAIEYINNFFLTFMNNLVNTCKKFGINKVNKYRPYILAFSLGKFYVGNTVIINEDDPANIIEFISQVTRKENKGGWLGNLLKF